MLKIAPLSYLHHRSNWFFRCERLIDDGIAVLEDTTGSKNKEATIDKQALVYLHSLGAAIPRALNLALQLQRYFLTIRLKFAIYVFYQTLLPINWFAYIYPLGDTALAYN